MEHQTNKPRKPTKRRKALPKADPGDNFTYVKSYSEEMSENDLDALAMMVASLICEELRDNAHYLLRNLVPDINQLNEPGVPQPKQSETPDGAKFCNDYEIRCKFLPQLTNSNGAITEMTLRIASSNKSNEEGVSR